MKNTEEFLSKMFTCDYILANDDRHYNNFGLIRNVETLEYTRMAPIYDTGNCLWHQKQRLELPADYSYSAEPFGKEGKPPEKQLELFSEYGWFHENALSGFADEAVEILAQNPNMPQLRLNQIKEGINQNIEHVIQYVRKCCAYVPGSV